MMKRYAENVQHIHFSVVDYCVFVAMLVLSAVTGIYFGYYRKNYKLNIQQEELGQTKKSADFGSRAMNEYLLGSRRLKVLPVAASLIAGYVSGVTMLGTPAEIYTYGTQYWFIAIAISFMGVAVSLVYLPVFATLGLGSSYQYLEMRFNSTVRSAASIMFIMDEIFFLPMIVYVPSLAFSQVSGINTFLIGSIVCVVCVIYTLLGGIKAVVVTDAWQVAIMFISAVVVIILGNFSLGSIEEIWRKADEGGRVIFFNFSSSMYERNTFWGVLFGGFVYWTSFNSVNQTMVQRYMSLPNIRKAQMSVVFFVAGAVVFISVCCYAGLLIYAAYEDCDPKKSGLISKSDQMFPLFVMQTVGHLRGVPGLFIAGVFGASLSSLSVVLNSTAAVLLEDITKGCFKIKLTERAATILVKTAVLILGIIAMGLMFVIEKLGSVLSVATSLSAIAASTTFGVFTLGMLIPWSNSIGAISGALCGALMSGWVSFGSQYAVANGFDSPGRLPVSTEGCDFNVTKSVLMSSYESNDDFLPLYKLSFHWISPIGVFTTIFIGTIASFITGATNVKTLDADLLSPVIHRFLPKECFEHVHDESTELPSYSNRVATITTHLLPDMSGSNKATNSKT